VFVFTPSSWGQVTSHIVAGPEFKEIENALWLAKSGERIGVSAGLYEQAPGGKFHKAGSKDS